MIFMSTKGIDAEVSGRATPVPCASENSSAGAVTRGSGVARMYDADAYGTPDTPDTPDTLDTNGSISARHTEIQGCTSSASTR